MPTTKKKIARKLKNKSGIRNKPRTRAFKKAAKKPAGTLGKKIETQNRKIAPSGTSLEVFEVVETQVYERPVLGELDEEET